MEPLASDAGVAPPLVLVVEDDATARQLRADRLKKIGCEVIPASSVDAALEVLRDGPSVDLIVTDIHLGGSSHDRGGVVLAQTVINTYDDELPVAGYSGLYYDQDLSEEERGLFVVRQPRARRSRQQREEFYVRCRQIAIDHRTRRMERGREHGRAGRTAVRTREFVLADEMDHVEEVISKLGYELRLIGSSAFAVLATTVPVWVRSLGDRTEAQVCGQPFLHWEDETEEATLQGLVAIMEGFAADFRALGIDPVGPARRLRDFLEGVIVANEIGTQ